MSPVIFLHTKLTPVKLSTTGSRRFKYHNFFPKRYQSLSIRADFKLSQAGGTPVCKIRYRSVPPDRNFYIKRKHKVPLLCNYSSRIRCFCFCVFKHAKKQMLAARQCLVLLFPDQFQELFIQFISMPIQVIYISTT